MVKKTICIIPARKNSKRIKNKNIIDFDGKPMIFWTIKAAIESDIFDRIVVSTDCTEIANIAKKNGIEVPFLREGLSDDFTPISDVTIAVLKQVENYYNERFEVVVQMMANCPNRDSNDILNGYNYFINNGLEFLLSCSKFHSLIPWWSFILDESNKPNYNFPDLLNKRSQDLDESYCVSGAFWIAKISELMSQKTFYGNNHHTFPLNWASAIDIDTYDDLKIAKIARTFIQDTND